MGRRRNRRGGGGGGGGANASLGTAPIAGIPEGGLYGGAAGEALTNQDPTSFWRSLITRGGGITGTGSPSDTFINEQMIPWLEDDYRSQLALNQNLSVADYTRNNYGAGYDGATGQTPTLGTFSLTGNTPLAQRYQNWFSNENPVAYSVSEATRLGGYEPGSGNTGFQDWYASDWVPQQQAGLEVARQSQGPTLSMRDYLGAQDILTQARRAYALRPSATRVPSPITNEGRYSWWA